MRYESRQSGVSTDEYEYQGVNPPQKQMLLTDIYGNKQCMMQPSKSESFDFFFGCPPENRHGLVRPSSGMPQAGAHL